MPFFGFRRTTSLKHKKKKNSEPTASSIRKEFLGIEENKTREIKRFSDGLLDQSLVADDEHQDHLANNIEVVEEGTPETVKKQRTLPLIQDHVKTEDLDSPTVGKSELGDFKVPTLEPPEENNTIVSSKTTENAEQVVETPASSDAKESFLDNAIVAEAATVENHNEEINIIPSNGESTSSESEKEPIVVLRRRERPTRNNRRRAKNANDIRLHRRSQHFEDNPIDVLSKAKYRQSRNFEEDIENSKQARAFIYSFVYD